MLILNCNNGIVVWFFEYKNGGGKQAHCANDEFKVAYDELPGPTWLAMLRAVISHSVSLQGAILHATWAQP